MFILTLIFCFLIWIILSHFIFQISKFKIKSWSKKFFYISSLIFIIPFFILLILRKFAYLTYLGPIYIVDSIIISTLMYVVIFSPVTILVSIFLKKKNKIQKIFFYIIISTAFIFSIVGYLELISTQKITTLNIKTENKNLIGKKFVFLADPQFSMATQSHHAKKITNILEKIKPENIFIAGDIFNGEELNWQPILSEMKKWSEVAPVYVVLGNHEFYGDYNEFIKILNTANFKIVNNETINLNGVKVYGLTYPNNDLEKNKYKEILFDNLKKYKEDIIFMHEPPYDIAYEISKYDPTFIFSGHTHNGQF